MGEWKIKGVGTSRPWRQRMHSQVERSKEECFSDTRTLNSGLWAQVTEVCYVSNGERHVKRWKGRLVGHEWSRRAETQKLSTAPVGHWDSRWLHTPTHDLFPEVNKHFFCEEIKQVLCFVVDILFYFVNSKKWLVGQRFSRNEVKENRRDRKQTRHLLRLSKTHP